MRDGARLTGKYTKNKKNQYSDYNADFLQQVDSVELNFDFSFSSNKTDLLNWLLA